MNQNKFSEAMGGIDDKYVVESIGYRKKGRKQRLAKWGAAAACLAVAAVTASLLLPSHSHMTVSAYACGTDDKATADEITAAGVVIQSGSISDAGEMKGKPLMFYLSGQDIATVRFSCREQQLYFTDWTEKRDEYGNARNFTVNYGPDESEYYYLTIDWVPDAIIRELTDHPDSAIASLPEEMRNDLIVMEITFTDGETATKAMEVSLLDDGTFFASFDDYRISETDAFVRRPDSEAIPRETLYAQGSIADAPPMVCIHGRLYKQSTEQISYDEAKEDFVYLGEITSDVTNSQSATDGVPQEDFQANHPIVGAGVWQYGDDIVVLIDGRYWLYEDTEESGRDGTAIGGSASAARNEDPEEGAQDGAAIGSSTSAARHEDSEESGQDMPDSLSEEEKRQLDPSYGSDDSLRTAEEAARAYYADTVFTVISMELKQQTEEEIVFTVRVSKGGIVQEPDRSITLQPDGGAWKVVNEGY